MPSEKQIAANRLNARRSTGPRTEEGKAQSSRNAMTHGLRASVGLFPHECPDEFFQMRDAIFAELLPQDAVESELTHRIVSILWRLRRIPAFEAAALAWVGARGRKVSVDSLAVPSLAGDPGAPPPDQDVLLALGRSFDAFLTRDLGGKIGRYEATLQRQLISLFAELRTMKACRNEAAPSLDGVPVPEEGGC